MMIFNDINEFSENILTKDIICSNIRNKISVLNFFTYSDIITNIIKKGKENECKEKGNCGY